MMVHDGSCWFMMVDDDVDDDDDDDVDDDGDCDGDGDGLPFRTRTSFQPPIQSSQPRSQSWTEERIRKNETCFSVANCCGAWKGRQFVKDHVFAQEIRPWWLIILGYPQILRIFLKGLSALEVAEWTWQVHLESILGLINRWEVKDTIFNNTFSEMAMMRCFCFHQRGDMVLGFTILEANTFASFLEEWRVRCSFQHSNVSAFSKNAGRRKKVQLSNEKT